MYMFNTSLVSVEQRYNLNSAFSRVRSGIIPAHPPNLLPLHLIILWHEQRTVSLYCWARSSPRKSGPEPALLNIENFTTEGLSVMLYIYANQTTY